MSASNSPETSFANLGLELPPAPKPIGLYKPIVIVGNLAYLSGHGPLHKDGTLTKGRMGDSLSVEEGYAAAKQTGLAMIATLKASLGSLDRVKRLVKVFGLVCCTEEFDQQPAVINGASQLFADVWGAENGIAARSAVGATSLPSGMAVEIEAIFEIE